MSRNRRVPPRVCDLCDVRLLEEGAIFVTRRNIARLRVRTSPFVRDTADTFWPMLCLDVEATPSALDGF